MKTLLPLLAALALLFASCKKENTQPNNNPNNQNPVDTTHIDTTIVPADPFAANQALVSSNAKLYFIADVEGLDGVTHINQQDTIWGVTAQWSQEYCNSTACGYGGGLGNTGASQSWVFKVDYFGTGQTREQMLTDQYAKYLISANGKNGLALTYIAQSGNTFYSFLTNNTTISWANLTLADVTPSGISATPYYITLKFNCELKCANNGCTQVIRFKNAIARVRL